MNDKSVRLTTSFVKDNILVLSISTREVRDFQVARALGDELTEAAAQFYGNKVVLDLQHLEFIGSVGLLGLLRLRRQLSERNGRIVICSLRESVQDMFVACRLINPTAPQSATFESETTVEDALPRLMA
jgi:anti-anti-sigma factor